MRRRSPSSERSGGEMRARTAAFRRSARPGFAILLVVFAIAIATIVLIALQASGLRQAAAGREAVARLRAYWAARAGLEATIARIESNITSPPTGDAFAEQSSLVQVSSGRLDGARWLIRHTDGTTEREGPEDPSAKININLMTKDDLMKLPAMTEDVADAILDWIDTDDDPRELGAEVGYYSQLPTPYKPRNGPIPRLEELRLVVGVDPILLFGEDANANGRLDPNENDGALSLPPDNANNTLEGGWGAVLTAASVDEGLAASGKPRLNLKQAKEDELIAAMSPVPLNALQARVILNHAASATSMVDYISQSLRQLAQGQQGLGVPVQAIQNLDDEQLGKLYDECTVADPAQGPQPGKLNINLARRETFDYFAELDASFADSLAFAVQSRSQGFTNIMQLMEVPGMTRGRLAQVARIMDVRSNSYVISSRGRDLNTGVEVEIGAVVQKTQLPVVISDLIVR
ncbi:MAG: general secretion pathway protein GspK [Phycisphaerales bacterium]|nr:general secretion pathway protein GspK [Phycisphaerales bacterium]